MMLQALIAYAEREKLGDADFESVSVRWLIPLDKSGKLAGGPIPLAENPDDKKPRPKQMLRPFTSPNELNQGTKSHFLCDTLERATLLLDPKAADKAEGRRVQHGYFQSLLKEAAAEFPDESPLLQAVLAFLMSTKEILLEVAEKLSPDATLVDAIYELEFRQAVEEGLASLDRGEGIPSEEVKSKIAAWAGK